VTPALPTYAVVTPARNEATNLMRLARAIESQTISPVAWVIVDDGSVDGTIDLARALASEHQWVDLVEISGPPVPTRGGPVARAFVTGVGRLAVWPEVIVKLDADIAFEPDFFVRLLTEFARDPLLGIASGVAYEFRDGEWRAQHVTRSHVRGATRAYRAQCLADVSPIEERMGWDTVDEIKAELRGWRTRSFPGIQFYHYRRLAARESSRHAWIAQGELAHYLGYRPSYVAARALFNARRDPNAIMLVSGYVAARVLRRPRCADPEVARHLRTEQRLRRLPLRAAEAFGRRAGS
jgi:biofilm PGA synthesis N-glycosyltransferase PgaC